MRIVAVTVATAAVLAVSAGCASSGAGGFVGAPGLGAPGDRPTGQDRRAAPIDPGTEFSGEGYVDALRTAGVPIPADSRTTAAETGEILCQAYRDGVPVATLREGVDAYMSDIYTRAQREQILQTLREMCPRTQD